MKVADKIEIMVIAAKTPFVILLFISSITPKWMVYPTYLISFAALAKYKRKIVIDKADKNGFRS
jgi:hypothetical protein